MDQPEIRRAAPSDGAALGDLYVRARRAAVPAIPPSVHVDDDVRRWFIGVVVPERETWLADDDGTVVGLMVLLGEWVDQLYVDPDRLGHGLGTRFKDLAKQRRPDGLEVHPNRFSRRSVPHTATDSRENDFGGRGVEPTRSAPPLRVVLVSRPG